MIASRSLIIAEEREILSRRKFYGFQEGQVQRIKDDVCSQTSLSFIGNVTRLRSVN
jgi:hypothetical protein